MANTRTRIAPSPTGEDIHIGNLYTALINFAVAKKGEGSFIIRIEDTDRARLVDGAIEKILSSLAAFGLSYDEGPGKEGVFGPYQQSERLSLYKKYAHQLVENGAAYTCSCSKEELDRLKENKTHARHFDICTTKGSLEDYEGTVIRLKVPAGEDVTFNDLIRGEIVINTDQIDDQILIKSDGFPTYHMAVVVDDHLMEISHIIRAEEWISSTPKHVLLYQALGWEMPFFAHVPILRNPDKSKLSKRKNPVWASWYLDEGYLPEAVLNYLSLMGWSHPEQKEIFSLQEFIEVFDLKDVNTVGPAFDQKKLLWMNQQHIQNLSDEELLERILKFTKTSVDKDIILKLTPLVKTRLETLKDFEPQTRFIFENKGVTARDETERGIITKLHKDLSELHEFTTESVLGVLKNVLQEFSIKMSVLYMIFTGNERGLPLPDILALLGKDDVIKRLENVA